MAVVRNAFVALFVLASGAVLADDSWWSPNDAREFPSSLSYPNAAGVATTLNTGGPTRTKDHPFFTPLSENGRACVSCHQPSDGMSLSVDTIRARWDDTNGRDPIFAAIDGSEWPMMRSTATWSFDPPATVSKTCRSQKSPGIM